MNVSTIVGALFIAAGGVLLPVVVNHHDAPPPQPSHSHVWTEQSPAGDVALDDPDPLAGALAAASAEHALVHAGPALVTPHESVPASEPAVLTTPTPEKVSKAAKQSAGAKSSKPAKSSSGKAPKASKAPAQPKGPTVTVTDKTVTGPKGTTTTHTVVTKGLPVSAGQAAPSTGG